MAPVPVVQPARRPPLAAIRPAGQALRARMPPGAAFAASDPPGLAVLSPREREIARLVAKGMVNKTIGGVLDISPWTVATHLRRIFAKLGVTSRASMVAAIYSAAPPDDGERRDCG